MSSPELLHNAARAINHVKGCRLTSEERTKQAIELAGWMLEAANQQQSYFEMCQQQQLAQMMTDPKGKVFTTAMTDQCFRSSRSGRVADQIVYLIHKYGIPRYLSIGKRLALSLFYFLGKPLSFLMVPLTKYLLRKETSNVILPGERLQLFKHIRERTKEGIRVNLNRLGEAILGEEEANRRLEGYLEDLADPNVEYISIKISTICSQLNLLAWENTLSILSERLKRLYRAAAGNQFFRPDGSHTPKFVNLDMEEYRDLNLTVDLFQEVLEDPEFFQHSAGIVLQSYIPDSFLIQQQLTVWAMKRVANGGAPIKIRLVKGANLAMEQVEASLHGWQQTPYDTKADVDANFKRMLSYGCQPEHAHAVHLGIASHNLFDIAYGLLLRSEQEVESWVSFEMLEGMADPMRRVVQRLAGDMLLYCPTATKGEFRHAIAYLIRRLDENTAPDNFLRQAFDLVPGSVAWDKEAERFADAVQQADKISSVPRRTQNRFASPQKISFDESFQNEADTDWSLPQNRKWAETLMREWDEKACERIPLVIGGKRQVSQQMSKGEDPSRPGKTLYEYSLGNEMDIDTVLETALASARQWSDKSVEQRAETMSEVAQQLRLRRRALIGAMVADGGKTIPEADTEVSEAVDFAEYYSRCLLEIASYQDIVWKPRGVVLVAPPWNFPCSIPAGGVIAALVSGNSVILKPAQETVLVAWILVQAFWAAGIGEDVLQFFPCEDEPIGSMLIKDKRIACVVLTGATSTAKLFRQMRPDLNLLAETGGKNTIIVTSLADRDLAVKDIIQSAFGHGGQKCSACSLVICEKEVYYDEQFQKQLRDAAASLKVGSAWNLASRITPLIREANPTLFRGLTQLEEGEEWFLKPIQDRDNPRLWSPGIKWGVKPGIFTHTTELFGPMLGVMCAENLNQAIEFANATRYGLTTGLHSLDDREQRHWAEAIEAGNCYINRGITGAIVQRQPFGGCKESNFGPGAKAGGPNYLIELMQPSQESLPQNFANVNDDVSSLSKIAAALSLSESEKEEWNSSIGSYEFYWGNYFSKNHDSSHIKGQDNFLKYIPHRQLMLRIQETDRLVDILRATAGALTCRASLELSIAPGIVVPSLASFSTIKCIEEDDDQMAARLERKPFVRLRFLSKPSNNTQIALANLGVNSYIAPALANGRFELLHDLQEISLSIDYHRYGNLGERETK